MYQITLTEEDRRILRSYCVFVENLGRYLGEAYEIILHSLENPARSAICVVNGQHTGRTIGAPITDLAMTILDEIRKDLASAADEDPAEIHSSVADRYRGKVYFNRSKDGTAIRATTIPVLGQNDRIIGLVCINYYLNQSIQDLAAMYAGAFLQPYAANPAAVSLMDQASASGLSLTGVAGSGIFSAGSGATAGIVETFAQSTDEQILEAVEAARMRVLEDESITPANRNKEIVAILKEMGIFRIKDAVVKTADALGISKNTVYLHLRNLEKQGKE